MNPDIDFYQIARLLNIDRETLPKSTVEQRVEARSLIQFEPLSDEEFEIIFISLPLPPVPKPNATSPRAFLDAVLWFDAARAKGIGWGKLPEHLGPRSTQEHRFARWNMLQYWTQIENALHDDDRLSVSRRQALTRLAVDGEARRKRILAARARLTNVRRDGKEAGFNPNI